jgi:thiosulfate dehydrogenase
MSIWVVGEACARPGGIRRRGGIFIILATVAEIICKRRGKQMGRIIGGMILGLALVSAALLAWLRFGHPPVAVADAPLPYEQWLAQTSLRARIAREKPANAPIQADEDNLINGARIYGGQCSSCHGFHGRASAFGPHMHPAAPPLWDKHPNSAVVGVSGDPPGETFWKVRNGIRFSGMPAYRDVLSEAQIWQVSLLLATADKPLPPEAFAIVRGEQPPAVTQAAPSGR